MWSKIARRATHDKTNAKSLRSSHAIDAIRRGASLIRDKDWDTVCMIMYETDNNPEM